jgi:hypothetical protein
MFDLFWKNLTLENISRNVGFVVEVGKADDSKHVCESTCSYPMGPKKGTW